MKPFDRSLLVGLLLTSLASLTSGAEEPLELDTRETSRPVRAALFQASNFPTVDAPTLEPTVLAEALAGLPIDTLESPAELAQKLRLRNYDVLILPYGSAFPLDAWIPIRAFIQRGGGLVVLGGAPFQQPVLESKDGTYRLGKRQPTFAHEFQIGPAEVWTPSSTGSSDLAVVPLEAAGWDLDHPKPETVQELIVRLASRKDLDEHGSEGHRDAILRPLVHLRDPQGIPQACPLLEIDRLRGPEAGGRWVLATSDAKLSAPLIRGMVERALEGPAQLDARPVHASVESGELPLIRIAQRRPFVRAGERVPKKARVVVRTPQGDEIQRGEVELAGEPTSRHGVFEVHPTSALAPGLYQVDVETPDAPWHPRKTTTGFWVRDSDLLASAKPVTVSRDWLRSGGKVLPVIGTTYMASDVHRKFLFEPDPHTWDRDFAQMASLGINFVRTGLWTGWSRAMLNSGAVDEGFLRALDAYIQTAAKHGILVNFTFFAFLPPAYGGDNAYLDPRALEGQRELLTLVARRYRGVHWVHWDLINEPSYAPPEGLWSTQPVRDPYERVAWRRWVRDRHGDSESLLRDRWRDPARDVLALPGNDELYSAAIREHRRPRKVRDFMLFSQDVVTEWARQLRAILRTAGGDVLVTLGQDEGGTFTRSSQQLHAEAVDYTGLHPWWRNDDLLASGVMAKVPEKPNLFQETGLMRLEDHDGWPWRSPEVAARVLEAKYAYAFASRGAGVIEWAWNINPYQPIDNESVIGFFRPDGTAKPELRIVRDFAAFFEKAAPHLDDFEPNPVVAVIPHSRLFMARPGGAEGFKRLIRVLSGHHGIVPTGLSELRLTPERLRHAKLILVPSPLVLEDSAAEALLAASRAGTKVLVTGFVEGNPYGDISPALETLRLVDEGRPVALREATPWAEDGFATFDRDLREQLRRSTDASSKARGNIWHEPLPLEFARETVPLSRLLGAALESAGIETQPSEAPVAARLLWAPRAVFAILVNEGAEPASRTLNVVGRSWNVPIAPGRSRLLLFDRQTGDLLVANHGDRPVQIDTP